MYCAENARVLFVRSVYTSEISFCSDPDDIYQAASLVPENDVIVVSLGNADSSAFGLLSGSVFDKVPADPSVDAAMVDDVSYQHLQKIMFSAELPSLSRPSSASKHASTNGIDHSAHK